MSALPDQAYAAALAGFERMTVRRLSLLLQHHPPAAAFAVACGEIRPSGLVAKIFDDRELAALWRRNAALRTPDIALEQCNELGIRILIFGHDDYPSALQHDPAPPPVLFALGSLDSLNGRRVGIVGTRNATLSGRETAGVLGCDLTKQGIHIVSGLARGIDGCAHRGSFRAFEQPLDGIIPGAPIAVVASGLDVVYPPEHRSLWFQIAEQGLLLSEWPPGTPPEAYRFPLRNRIIAGLSEVLVVVESRSRGGSLITVEAARERDVTVMAVPGALRNRAAEGANALVREGCPIVMDAGDVLIALGLDSRRTGSVAYDPRPRPSRADQLVLDVCTEPVTLDHLILLTDNTLVQCAMAVARLEADGWINQIEGWFEQVRWSF
jgi:DNA processing protein